MHCWAHAVAPTVFLQAVTFFSSQKHSSYHRQWMLNPKILAGFHIRPTFLNSNMQRRLPLGWNYGGPQTCLLLSKAMMTCLNQTGLRGEPSGGSLSSHRKCDNASSSALDSDGLQCFLTDQQAAFARCLPQFPAFQQASLQSHSSPNPWINQLQREGRNLLVAPKQQGSKAETAEGVIIKWWVHKQAEREWEGWWEMTERRHF